MNSPSFSKMSLIATDGGSLGTLGLCSPRSPRPHSCYQALPLSAQNTLFHYCAILFLQRALKLCQQDDADDAIIARATGFANLETEEKLTPDHMFNCASTGKAMTCVTVSKFEVDHKVSIWDLTVPEAWPYNQPYMDVVRLPSIVHISLCTDHGRLSTWMEARQSTRLCSDGRRHRRRTSHENK